METFRRHGADLDARRQEAPGRDRRRADADHHQVRRERSGLHQRLRTGAHRTKPTSPDCRPRRSPARARAPQRKGLEGWRFTLQAPGLHRGDDLSRRRRHPPQDLRGLRRARRRRRARQPAADRAHPRTAPREGAPCWASPTSPTWCWKTAWRTPATAPWPSSKTSRARPSAASSEENQRAARIPPLHRRRRRARARAVGRRLLRREAARRALRFRRGGAAPLLPAGARGGRTVRTGAPPLRHPRGRGVGRAGVGPAACTITTCATRTASFSAASMPTGIPRENKRGGAWMDAPDHRRSRRPMASVRTWD